MTVIYKSNELRVFSLKFLPSLKYIPTSATLQSSWFLHAIYFCFASTLLCSLAHWACPLGSASTCESINAVMAGSSVLTGVAHTFIDILVTVYSLPARATVADVAR